jgi:hypothetical protein
MTLQEIKDQVAKEIQRDDETSIETFFTDWIDAPSVRDQVVNLMDKVAKRYAASECAAKDARIKELEAEQALSRDLIVSLNEYLDSISGRDIVVYLEARKKVDDLGHKYLELLTPKDKQP